MMLGLVTSNRTPVASVGDWLSDIQNNIGESGLSIDNQTPLLLGNTLGSSAFTYWLTEADKTIGTSSWDPYWTANQAENYANVPLYTIATIEGALIGASGSERGLIAPTTDIVSTQIVSSLIGALTLSSGKIVLNLLPQIQPTDLINGSNGTVRGGFSNSISMDDNINAASAKNEALGDCKCSNSACGNVDSCTDNNCSNGECGGSMIPAPIDLGRSY